MFVHPLQRKFFFLSLIPLILCAFLLITLVFLPLKLALAGAGAGSGPESPHGAAYVLAIRIWPAVLLSMVVSGLLSFYVTHKVAGPLYRLEQIARKAAEGDLPQAIRLRRRDDLQELAALLDRAFGTMAGAMRAVQDQAAQAHAEVAALRGELRAGMLQPQPILERLEAVCRAHAEVATILAGFRLPGPNGDGPAAGRATGVPGGRPPV